MLAATMIIASVPGLGLGGVVARVGLWQNWSMFAPDPVRDRLILDAEVEYADGKSTVWRVPRRGALAATFGYRWQLWARRAATDDGSRLWRRAAQWVAARARVEGRRPVRVTLRRRYAELPPPGRRSHRLRWAGFDFYTLDLR